MKTPVSFTLLTSLTLIGSAVFSAQLAAQTAVPEQALRELNIMRNIFAAAMEDNGNRRNRIDGPEALYLSGQGMVFTFDLPGGNSMFDFNGGDFSMFSEGDFNFSFDIDYDDDPAVITSAKAASQAAEAQQAAASQQVAQAKAISEYRTRLQTINEQMREKQQAMRELQREMRNQQREQQRARQISESDDFDDSEMERLGDEMEKLGDEIGNLSNNVNQIQQEYQSERDTAVAALHQQQSALIFDTLCNYGNTLRSLQNGEHVNLVLHSRDDDTSQVYVIDYASLTNCSSGAALQQVTTGYAMPGRNGF